MIYTELLAQLVDLLDLLEDGDVPLAFARDSFFRYRYSLVFLVVVVCTCSPVQGPSRTKIDILNFL